MSETLKGVLIGGGIGIIGSILAGYFTARHNRRLDALQDLRSTIDQALDAATDSLTAMSRILIATSPGRSGSPDDYDAGYRELSTGIRRINATLSKLKARFGPDHPIPIAVDDCRIKLSSTWSVTTQGVSVLDPRDRQALRTYLDRAEVSLECLESVAAEQLIPGKVWRESVRLMGAGMTEVALPNLLARELGTLARELASALRSIVKALAGGRPKRRHDDKEK